MVRRPHVAASLSSCYEPAMIPLPERRRGTIVITACARLTALSLASTVACGTPVGARSELGQRGAELAGASVDRSHTGVLALVLVTPQQVELCTATLLTPNLLLTARHCVADTTLDTLQCSSSPAFFGEPVDTDSLWVNHAAELSGPLGSFGVLALTGGSDEFLPVAQVRVPTTDVVCGGDIAALILDGQLDAEVAAPIAPRLDEPVTTGEAYVAVGFGATPAAGEQGVRRSRDGLEAACGGEDCRGLGNLEANEFAGGDGVCSGDSGGPAIAADGRVIGIASRSSDCTDSVYSALSSWRDFIRPIAQQALLLGDYPAPAWLAPLIVPDAGAGTEPAASDGGLAGVPSSDDLVPPVKIENVDPPPRQPVVGDGGGSGCTLGAPRAAPSGLRWRPCASCLIPLALLAPLLLRRRRALQTRAGARALASGQLQ
jgi:hypothetical protein